MFIERNLENLLQFLLNILGSMKLEMKILNNSYLDFFKVRTTKSNYTAKNRRKHQLSNAEI